MPTLPKPQLTQSESPWETPDCARRFGRASGDGVDLGYPALSEDEGWGVAQPPAPALESLLRKIKVGAAVKKGISEVVAQSEAR
jgi:hypothetical protein